MNDEKPIILVLVTAPDQVSAKLIAKALLDTKLAACVNILPGLISLYNWEGELQDEKEVQLFIKTRSDLLEGKIIPLIRELHPYDLPEIIAIPVVGGSSPYLDWIIAETEGENPS
jgi:periplasmic divalent cation tolerance protein